MEIYFAYHLEEKAHSGLGTPSLHQVNKEKVSRNSKNKTSWRHKNFRVQKIAHQCMEVAKRKGNKKPRPNQQKKSNPINKPKECQLQSLWSGPPIPHQI